MQKIALKKIIQEEILRAIVFASVLFAILFAGFGTLAYAADGGLFGNILNSILASGDWQNPGDGTVKNCEKLGNKLPTEYVQVTPTGFSCPATQCIYGMSAVGAPLCR